MQQAQALLTPPSPSCPAAPRTAPSPLYPAPAAQALNASVFFDTQRVGFLPPAANGGSVTAPWRRDAFTADYNATVDVAAGGFNASDPLSGFGFGVSRVRGARACGLPARAECQVQAGCLQFPPAGGSEPGSLPPGPAPTAPQIPPGRALTPSATPSPALRGAAWPRQTPSAPAPAAAAAAAAAPPAPPAAAAAPTPLQIRLRAAAA